MREIVVISGKGGTGKTTVVGSLVALAGRLVVADADVEAPNLHLLLSPRPLDQREFEGGRRARIETTRCVECGRCERACQFGAIEGQSVNPRRCEGCGACALVCPVGAISMEARVTGRILLSETPWGPLVHAWLCAGAEASGRLVTEVRRLAAQLARDRGAELVLVDGSPGIGCPVIASLTGAHRALIVSEPTLSGLHDLERVLRLVAHFRVPAAVVVNKWDINPEVTEQIEQLAQAGGASTMARIPFDEAITEANAEGVPLVIWADSPGAQAIRELWRNLEVR